MRAKLVLGITCLSLLLAGAASASDPADEAYDEGWDAANDFCRDVEREELDGTYRSRNITERFEENCKQGFDAYINNNRSCQRKLDETEGAYRAMWRARRQSCT